MPIEQDLIKNLNKKFKLPEDKMKVQRQRRISALVPLESFLKILDYLVRELEFNILCAITGLDEINNFGIIYHLAQESGVVLNLKVILPKEKPVLKTITASFPAAMIYEKEIMSLLGIKFEGIPELPRYPLPDDWPADQFPLRKDWSPEMLKKEKQKHA